MSAKAPQVGGIKVFSRLTRIQFLPLILLPGIIGTTLAYRMHGTFNFEYFSLVMLGIALLHLGANAIDDVYDYENGVDQVADSTFPKDFGGWKPIPRGVIGLRDAKALSYGLLLGSLLLAIYFTLVVGPWSLILGIAGIALAILYTGPPMKLDYRGKGLGEVAIMLAFGPIPILGAFYVQTGVLSLLTLLVSLPVGLLTVTVLIDHDLIFYEVYCASKKFSLGTIMGRAGALKLSLSLTLVSYALTLILVVTRILPLPCSIAPASSALVLARKAKTFSRPNEPPPNYVPFTVNGMIANWVFALLLGITILL